jgi:hypothetical protein
MVLCWTFGGGVYYAPAGSPQHLHTNVVPRKVFISTVL